MEASARDGDAAGARETGPAPFDPDRLAETIRALARPRLVGTAAARDVAEEIRHRFEALGFRTRELPFTFSTLPGRYGLPAAGTVLTATAAAAAWLVAGGRAGPAMGVLLLGLVLATLPLAMLDAALRLPWGRLETANMLFVRDRPRWIVMAHRDTKSQPLPTALRTAAIVLALVAWAGLAVLAISAWARDGSAAPGAAVWIAAGGLAVAGTLLALSPTGNGSPGALDNASGLAALLAAAERTPDDVAYLVTDGEELGLAGARAAADTLPRVAGIINVDGLDDRGPIRIAESRRWRHLSGAMATALLNDARALGFDVVRRPLPPFVLVDHEPLARAGRPALTVLKGGWRSLLRVHRPADSPDRLDGTGAARVAAVLVTMLGGLTAGDGDTLRSDEQSGHSPA